jgi:hypothetical protein
MDSVAMVGSLRKKDVRGRRSDTLSCPNALLVISTQAEKRRNRRRRFMFSSLVVARRGNCTAHRELLLKNESVLAF